MKIVNINIPKSDPNSDGLEEIKMVRLQEVVLLAGKNGSGKTRILHKIFKSLEYFAQVANLTTSIIELNNSLSDTNKAIEKMETEWRGTDKIKEKNNIRQHINTLVNQKEKFERTLNENIKLLDPLPKIEVNKFEKNNIIYFVPKLQKLTDPKKYNHYDLLTQANEINLIGVDKLPQGALAKIKHIHNEYWNATHPQSSHTAEYKSLTIENYRKLQTIINALLNTEIGTSNEGEPTLFGFPLGEANLSEGQSILIQYATAIFSQETDLNDLVLILDEPENYLHPSAVIDIVERLIKVVSSGQIWIGTHSVPLLAHFDADTIWFVENNSIKHAGKIPEKVLESLLGNEDEINRLQNFTSLPAQLASIRFVSECLLNPEAINTGSKDPQTSYIGDLIKNSNEKMSVLDYGAGKGRLISNIAETFKEENIIIQDKIDYVAFDQFDLDKEACISAIVQVYGTSDNRYFNDIEKLISESGEKKFDIVIMCNVLHEIDPINWLKLFQDYIPNLLNEKGYLMIGEATSLTIGEKAYKNGFLVFDRDQFKILFKLDENDLSFITTEEPGLKRIKSHIIPKKYISNIDKESRYKAIESLKKASILKIREFRSFDPSYKNGRLHGFWIEQLANAELNLEELTNNNSI